MARHTMRLSFERVETDQQIANSAIGKVLKHPAARMAVSDGRVMVDDMRGAALLAIVDAGRRYDAASAAVPEDAYLYRAAFYAAKRAVENEIGRSATSARRATPVSFEWVFGEERDEDRERPVALRGSAGASITETPESEAGLSEQRALVRQALKAIITDGLDEGALSVVLGEETAHEVATRLGATTATLRTRRRLIREALSEHPAMRAARQA